MGRDLARRASPFKIAIIARLIAKRVSTLFNSGHET
jgi:hypothetical protein